MIILNIVFCSVLFSSTFVLSVMANFHCFEWQLGQFLAVGGSSAESDSISLPCSLLSFPVIAVLLLFHKGVIGLGTDTPGIHSFKIRFSDNSGNIRICMGSIPPK
jgi:hypothetical protein